MWFPGQFPAARRATREPPIGPVGATRHGSQEEGAPLQAVRRGANTAPLRAPSSCSCGGRCPRCAGQARGAPAPGGPAERHASPLTSQPGDASEHAAQAMANAALASSPMASGSVAASGEPLPPRARRHLERHFGADLKNVRLHHGSQAQASARSLGAQAYTLGQDIVMGSGWRGDSPSGGKLLAHEVAHTVQVQRGQASPRVAHRQIASEGGGFSSNDADLAAEREYGSGPAPPNAQTCGRPPHCPPGFCDPYRTVALAQYYRAKNGPLLMAGIAAAVDSRVVPLWRDYLNGGSAPRNLSASFGADFTASPSTARASGFVRRSLQLAVPARLASVAAGSPTTVSLPAFRPTTAAALDDPASANQMNFNIPGDIPGNLAGGIGKDQKSCPSGAMPSPFNDERQLRGSARVERISASQLRVTPDIQYTVRDTIDLCPGDCGTKLEQIATVPLSQFEATGISGDVPYTVDFPAPATANASFDVTAAAPAPAPATVPTAMPTPTPAPVPVPTPVPLPPPLPEPLVAPGATPAPLPETPPLP